jgi:hypothetical protein
MIELEFLQRHCEFNNKYDCYVLLAVSRKKDTPEMTSSQEIVFRKIIKNSGEITRKYLQILAETTNYQDENGKAYPFYIYVSLNARDSYKATHILMRETLSWMSEEHQGIDRSNMFKRVDNHFYSALMKPECKTRSQRYFFIDYDEKTRLNDFLNDSLMQTIEVQYVIETRNGYHIKVKPFDTRIIEALHKSYPFEVKRDDNIFVKYVEAK